MGNPPSAGTNESDETAVWSLVELRARLAGWRRPATLGDWETDWSAAVGRSPRADEVVLVLFRVEEPRESDSGGRSPVTLDDLDSVPA